MVGRGPRAEADPDLVFGEYGKSGIIVHLHGRGSGPEKPREGFPAPILARMMHEMAERERGDGRATGQPSRGTAGLDLSRTFSVRRKLDDVVRSRPEVDGTKLSRHRRDKAGES
jgi:hypothetical protein